MIFSFRKTFNAATTELTKQEFLLAVVKGLVYKLEIRFVPGCSGLLYLEFYYSGSKLWPKNYAGYFSGNDEIITFDETQFLSVDPAIIILKGYNLDDVWSHDVMIRIGMVDHETYLQRYLPDIAARLIKEQNERIETENERIETGSPIFNLIFRKR